MDWSTLSVVDLMEQIRMSAGTLSPTGQMQNRQIFICVRDNTSYKDSYKDSKAKSIS